MKTRTNKNATRCGNKRCPKSGDCEFTFKDCFLFKYPQRKATTARNRQKPPFKAKQQQNQVFVQPTISEPYNGFIIHQKLPSLNEYINACRANPHLGAQLKRDTEEAIGLEILVAKSRGCLKVPKPPVKITFVWHESTKRRDLDNIFSAKKYILDAMQETGILENDSRKFVVGLTDEIVDDTADYVEVKIYEAAI